MNYSITTPFNRKNLIQFVKQGLLCFFIVFGVSCKKTASPVSAPAKDTTAGNSSQVAFPRPSYNPSGLDTTKIFDAVPVASNLVRHDLIEISGVAASRTNPGILYIHNDSGNPNQVYLIDGTGADKGTLNLPVSNRDWEDIAVGPGPVPGKNYIYVGDIGDNKSIHPSSHVYRFVEPDLTGLTLPVTINIDQVDDIELKYPDGPCNAETLMADPLTKDIYIASKQSNLSKIYVARYPQSTTTTTVMAPVAELLFNKTTGGDISPDGTEILLRSNELIWCWKLRAGTSISAGLLMQPQVAPYADNEPQGEEIGFAADGSGYYTDTEIKDYPGHPATVSFYKRK